MLNAIIRFSLRYRVLIVFLSLAALVYGGYVTTQLPIDVFPDLDRPRVVVMTECPGLAPEEVATLVTYPLETSLLGATGVQDVRSDSAIGLSVIYVEFGWGTDIRLARQVVQERLATVQETLPPGIRPQMAPLSSIMGQIMQVGIYPKGDRPLTAEEQLELRTLADWVIRPRLLKVSGIAQVTVVGAGRKQYQVLADPNALASHEVTLLQLEELVRRNDLNASGGYTEETDKERAIRIRARLGPDPKKVIAQLKEINVKPEAEPGGLNENSAKSNGKEDIHPPIKLEKVARVVEGPQLKRGDASVNGKPAVILTITKQPHVDTRALTDEITKALEDVKSQLPPDVEINTHLFQMKRFIDLAVFNVAEALVIGAVLVLLILFLFLLNFRTTFISLTAIPLSLVITALVFKAVGWITGTELTINVMTLGGIAVALGELVDDAIVDVENIFRRLRENHALPHPRPALQVIYEASVEIRSAIVFGTAMVILVFVPLFALSGIEGRLFTPLGVAYIVSILASLLVSLTVTPVLSYYLLPQAKATHRTKDSPLLRFLKWGASHLIRFSMARAGWILLITWILVGICVVIVAKMKKGFLPDFDEGSVQVNVTLPPGSPLRASNEASARVDAVFRDLQKSERNPNGPILHFARRSGRAELDEHVEPVSNTEYILSMNLDSGRSREEIIEEVQTKVREAVPDAFSVETEQPLAHLISHMLSGVTAQIAIKVYGQDIDKLQRVADDIKRAIGDVPGIRSVAVEPLRLTDELHIDLKPAALTRYKVDRAYVARFLELALRGEVVSQILDGERRFDVLVRLDDAYRTDYEGLKRLLMPLPNGRGLVPVGEVAEIGPGLGPNVVKRDNLRRRIVVKVNTTGRDLGSVVAGIDQRIKERVAWPKDYAPAEYGGQFESQQRATRLITILIIVAIAGMFVVLYMLYPSARIVLQILNALPTAFIGGVLALLITNQKLTVAGMVGFISLGGIAARNGILLVTHYFHLMKYEGEGFTPQMVLRGSLERLSPVLMTALTAGIGLVPLVLGGQEPGREILYPVATVILGGLITSTLCEFLIHPGLFWRFSGKDAERLTHEMEPELSVVKPITE